MAFDDEVARLEGEVRQSFSESETALTTFPSGAVSLTVRICGRAFVFDYFPSYEMFGVDELGDDDGFNTGYRFGFKDFESARAKLLSLLEEAQAIKVGKKVDSAVGLTLD